MISDLLRLRRLNDEECEIESEPFLFYTRDVSLSLVLVNGPDVGLLRFFTKLINWFRLSFG